MLFRRLCIHVKSKFTYLEDGIEFLFLENCVFEIDRDPLLGGVLNLLPLRVIDLGALEHFPLVSKPCNCWKLRGIVGLTLHE